MSAPLDNSMHLPEYVLRLFVTGNTRRSVKAVENIRRICEEIELHSTILIDRQGRVHWKRAGGDPFTDTEFLTGSPSSSAARP